MPPSHRPADSRARRDQDEITASMNEALAEIGEEENQFSDSAVQRVLEQSEW